MFGYHKNLPTGRPHYKIKLHPELWHHKHDNWTYNDSQTQTWTWIWNKFADKHSCGVSNYHQRQNRNWTNKACRIHRQVAWFQIDLIIYLVGNAGQCKEAKNDQLKWITGINQWLNWTKEMLNKSLRMGQDYVGGFLSLILPFRVGSVGGVSAGTLLIFADRRLRLPATVGTIIVTVLLLVEWDRSRHRLLLLAQCLASALKFSYTEGLNVSTHKLSEFNYIWIGRVFYFFYSVRSLILSSSYLLFTMVHCLKYFI